jgi:hypothetical protein
MDHIEVVEAVEVVFPVAAAVVEAVEAQGVGNANGYKFIV